MADVFPRRNLPGEAEQWGRDVEGRIQSADAALESIQQSLQGQNRNIASSLSVIAEQLRSIQEVQEEILAQATYTNEDEGVDILLGAGTAVPADLGYFAPVYFTLNDARRVRVETSAYFASSLVNYGDTAIDSGFRAAYGYRFTREEDGFVWSRRSFTEYGARRSGVSGVASGSRVGVHSQYSDILKLPAGTYTAVTPISFLQIDGDAGAVRMQTPRVVVQVLNKD